MNEGARTVVVGLGNPVRADDGVGLAVARELARLLALEPIDGVSVRTAERGGFELLDLLSGAERAVVVDCLERPMAWPGRVRQLTVDNIAGASRLVGAHDLSIAAALELGRLLSLPMPSRVEVIGIEPADTTTVRDQLTPAVSAVVQPVARWLRARLSFDTSSDVPMHRARSTFGAAEDFHGDTPCHGRP